jgi:Fe2+ or Zn2+ uptake regulation protein
MKNIDKIYEIISNCSCPITVSDILKRLNVEVNKTTVYRNIENLLSDSKIIEDFSPS